MLYVIIVKKPKEGELYDRYDLNDHNVRRCF